MILLGFSSNKTLFAGVSMFIDSLPKMLPGVMDGQARSGVFKKERDHGRRLAVRQESAGQR